MAKYTKDFTGNYHEFVDYINRTVLSGSLSASFEDKVEYNVGNTNVTLLVYERYSFIGKNRVSLSILITGLDNTIKLSAISSGGSQAVIFKINTFGEGAFLDNLAVAVENYIKNNK